VARGIEYLVCLSQYGKVTFVNNEWQGRVAVQQGMSEDQDRVLDSCPDFCDYLQQAGRDGWELVAAYALALPDGVQEKLILKRSR
jgi:hypothetical protein